MHFCFTNNWHSDVGATFQEVNTGSFNCLHQQLFYLVAPETEASWQTHCISLNPKGAPIAPEQTG